MQCCNMDMLEVTPTIYKRLIKMSGITSLQYYRDIIEQLGGDDGTGYIMNGTWLRYDNEPYSYVNILSLLHPRVCSGNVFVMCCCYPICEFFSIVLIHFCQRYSKTLKAVLQ